jgi:UDP-N-acetylmuramyl pentapeptide phosphotransferase/UDP-N-acetylglucosamine-1-phosphate transferase
MDGIVYHLTIVADLVSFFWLLGMTYTTKLLDGLDGLVSGVTAIGALVVFGVTQLADVQQAGTGAVALALAGACLGFLVFNFYPARIFLGEGGSLLCGFLLGSLAIVSGGKIATALLIMGIPILDVVWVIFRRLVLERRSPLASADRKHLHFRLLDVGLSHRGAVLFLYALTAVFGSATLFVRGTAKLAVLGCLAIVMVLLGVWLVVRLRKRASKGGAL